jgi:phage-related protein/ribosome-binding protein aMBF1 (putative translation factor)
VEIPIAIGEIISEDRRLTTQAVYYRDASGHEPVDAWIDALPAKVALKVDNSVDLLNGLPDDAPPLTFPFSSQFDGPLRELRCHYGRRLIRVLYQRSGNLLVLLHAIEKAGRAVPARDIELAKERMADFQARMDAWPRVPPRAAGHDAPSAAGGCRRNGRLTDLISSDKVPAMTSPIGKTTVEGANARAARSAAYRAERERTRSWVAIAKLVIQRRTVLGMTQQELATRAKTSYSAISRLEGGRHATHLETLHRIFAGLGADLLVGYEVRADDESRKKRDRELVAV